jgi:hypothetical protein
MGAATSESQPVSGLPPMVAAGRKRTGFQVCEQSNGYYMADVLLTNVHASAKIFYAVFNPELGTWSGLIPQMGDQFRASFVYPKTMGYRLLPFSRVSTKRGASSSATALRKSPSQ